MSIQGLIGLPGHGKSYSAIELFILQAANQKRYIVTNIPLLPKLQEDYPDLQGHPIDLTKAAGDRGEFDRIPGGALVLLDELWRIWPAGLKANDVPVWQLEFIKEHRHKLSDDGREMDIVLVTQDMADICTPIRTMCETTILCEKLTAVGQKGLFRRDYYRGVVTLTKQDRNRFIKSDHGCKYSPDVYQYYKSHTKSQGEHETIDNSGVVNATIFGSLGFKIAAGFLVVCLVGIIWGASTVTSDIDKMTAPKSDKTESASVSVPHSKNNGNGVTASVSQQTGPQESKRYRLVGRFVQGVAIRWFVVSDGSRSRRVSPDQCKIGLMDQCIVDGELVTSYTGPDESAPSLKMLPMMGASSAG